MQFYRFLFLHGLNPGLNNQHPKFYIYIIIHYFFSQIKEMEESPFEKYQTKTVTLYVEPLLDTYNQTYVSALTLNAMPDGPLSKTIRIYNSPNLSPFQTFTNTINSPNNCTYIIMKHPNANKSISTNWMLEEDIPTVFSFLQANNYKIDTSLTKLLNHSQVNLGGSSQIKRTGNRRMVCMFSFSFPDKL